MYLNLKNWKKIKTAEPEGHRSKFQRDRHRVLIFYALQNISAYQRGKIRIKPTYPNPEL